MNEQSTSLALRPLSIEDMLRLTDSAADAPEISENSTITITPDQARAIAQMAAEYRRLRGLTSGQTRPCVLYHGVWPEPCTCTPRCALTKRCPRQQVGHYLYTRAGRTLSAQQLKALGVPTWSRSLDGGYAPGTDEFNQSADYQPERLVRVTHEQGWTLYAFWDRSIDHRGGSNSVILVQGTWEYRDLEAIASHALPMIWARVSHGMREERPDEYRRLMLGGEF